MQVRKHRDAHFTYLYFSFFFYFLSFAFFTSLCPFQAKLQIKAHKKFFSAVVCTMARSRRDKNGNSISKIGFVGKLLIPVSLTKVKKKTKETKNNLVNEV